MYDGAGAGTWLEGALSLTVRKEGMAVAAEEEVLAAEDRRFGSEGYSPHGVDRTGREGGDGEDGLQCGSGWGDSGEGSRIFEGEVMLGERCDQMKCVLLCAELVVVMLVPGWGP
jgi:hypothetical protein